MFKGFREFVMRGNVVDLAVGIVIGAAFTSLVNAFVAGVINPIISAVFGKQNLDKVATFTIHNADFSLGHVLGAVLNFLLVAAALYFLVVVPINRLRARFEKPAEEEALAAATEVGLLTEIRDALRARG
jgi:large conductance mechanosensitive channel